VKTIVSAPEGLSQEPGTRSIARVTAGSFVDPADMDLSRADWQRVERSVITGLIPDIPGLEWFERIEGEPHTAPIGTLCG
jgi:hypothetical protein